MHSFKFFTEEWSVCRNEGQERSAIAKSAEVRDMKENIGKKPRTEIIVRSFFYINYKY